MKQQQTDPSGHGHRRTGSFLLRGVVLAAAVGAGMLATYAATAPSALAATVVAGIDGDSLVVRMHGHSHAQIHAHFMEVLTDAGVDEAQKQQIEIIVKGAMEAQHADLRRYHETLGRTKALLTAARIDEAAVERTRSEQDALLLDTNRRLTETLVQVARALTPAQRQALGTEIDRMMASRIGHHHAD